jgi:Tol biopolymer transport system component
VPRLRIALLLVAIAAGASAEERIADVRQGTNLTVALAPRGRTLVVDLLGQLWTLPASGGAAVPVTPPGEHVRNPRFSPDGERIVYQRLVDGQWDIWLLDLTTGMREALTSDAFDEREPDFAADGRSVVYASNRSGQHAIWSIALDGRAQIQLTSDAGTASYPTVSEHGLVAYLLAQGGTWSLRVRAPDGSTATVYTSGQRLWPASWRPGGGVLVFGDQQAGRWSRLQLLLLAEPRVLKTVSGAEDLFASRVAWLSSAEFIYAADGQLWRRGIAAPVRQPVHLFAGSAVEVAAVPEHPPALEPATERPVTAINGVTKSPDGRRTVFTALGDLWLAERGSTQRLTDDVFVDLDPTFWPDGESIVFASERTGQLELWRLALRERKLTQLTFGALQPRSPAVRADGKRLAYVASASLVPWAAKTVEVLDLPNGEPITVAEQVAGAAALTWSPDGRTLTISARAGVATGAAVAVQVAGANAAASGGPPAAGEALPPLRWKTPAPPPDYVVEVGRLFDGVRSTYRRHVDMHVRGGRIAAIVGRGVLPASGPVVDARDATVIPGLIDVHAHQSAIVGERLGRAWLAYGVTTVRELATTPGEARERAEAWASGRSVGPRLIVTPDAAPAAVAPNPSHAIADSFVHSLRRQALELRIPLLAAQPYPIRLRTESAAHAPWLELSPGFAAYQDGISRLVTAGTTFVAGLGALTGLDATSRSSRDPAYRALYTTVEQAAWQQPDDLDLPVAALRSEVARLVRAGGRVAIGSDAPAVPFGLGVHLELAELARAGIANDQLLRMATVEGALALGLEQQVGTLEEGKVADFVVLSGDPLASIDDTLAIVAIAKEGELFERQALLAAP